jgi:hypothetical protein
MWYPVIAKARRVLPYGHLDIDVQNFNNHILPRFDWDKI